MASAPADGIATSTRPREGALGHAKAPSRRLPGHGVGPFNPHRRGEIGPPRSGFVLRGCIRKAGGAWGEATLIDGPADTTFFGRRIRWDRQAEKLPSN